MYLRRAGSRACFPHVKPRVLGVLIGQCIPNIRFNGLHQRSRHFCLQEGS